MSTIYASPGKENSLMGEKNVTAKDLENLVKDTEEIAKQISSIAPSTSGLDSGDVFNVLGAYTPIIQKLVGSFNLCLRLMQENDSSMKNMSISAIEGLEMAKELSKNVDLLLKTTGNIFGGFDDGSKITAGFEKFGGPLGEILEQLKSLKEYKGLANDVVNVSVVILDKMKVSSSGPFDSSLLSSVETFLSNCFTHTNFKLRLSAVGMWNETFARSKELEYSDKFRPILLATAKKHSMFLPGLSVETIEEPKTPNSKKEGNTHKIRSAKKRVMALVDEDSVDYVPISSPASQKKMKLTEHQKEMFSTTRDKIPLMDEDSILPGNMPKCLAEQFDVETSMSGSQSVKKLAKRPSPKSAAKTSPIAEKEIPKPLPEPVVVVEKKKEVPEAKKEEKEAPVVVSDEKEDDSNSKDSAPIRRKKRSAVVKAEEKKEEDSKKKEERKGFLKIKKIQLKKVPVDSGSDVGSEPSRGSEGSERRSKARRSLKMAVSPQEEVKKEAKVGQKVIKKEVVEAEESSVSSSAASSTDSSSELSQDSADVAPKRSRRSQAKGTPSKFVPKPRLSRKSVEMASAASEDAPVIKKKRGRKPKKSVEPESADETVETAPEPVKEVKKEVPDVVEKPAVIPDVVEDQKAADVEEVAEEKAVEVEDKVEDVTMVEEELQKTEEEPIVELDEESDKEEEMVILDEMEEEEVPKEKSPSPVSNDLFTTPMKPGALVTTPLSALRRTPGILKKEGTPSTAEKQRRRVHFPEEAVFKEEKNAIVATPRINRGGFATPRPESVLGEEEEALRNNQPVFPALSENTESIAKIIAKLLPISNSHTGTDFLRRALQSKKIFTVGDLARSTGKDISALPVKNPRYDTVKAVLEEHALSIGITVPQALPKKDERPEEELVLKKLEPEESPALQVQISDSPVKELKQFELTPTISVVHEVEPKKIVPVESTPSTTTTNSAADNGFDRFHNDMKAFIASTNDTDSAKFTPEQLKQLLKTTSEAMSVLSACQTKLIAHLT